MALTKQAHKDALQVVNNLYIRAIAKDNTVMIAKWGAERNRLTEVLINWKDNNADR